MNKSRRCFFDKINRINNPLTRLIKKKKEKTQVNKTRKSGGEITSTTTEIERMIKNYYKQL